MAVDPRRLGKIELGFNAVELVEELQHLVQRLDEKQVDFALCGGLAMAVYAFPRATLDIDLMVQPGDLAEVKAVARELGFNLDVGLLKFKQDRVQIYRLTKTDPEEPFPLVLDMLLATPEMEDVWKTRRRVEWEHGSIPVVSPEGLIRMKSLRSSGQDRDDIEHLKRLIDEG